MPDINTQNPNPSADPIQYEQADLDNSLGYRNATYTMGLDDPATLDKESAMSEDVNTLSEKLGVDPQQILDAINGLANKQEETPVEKELTEEEKVKLADTDKQLAELSASFEKLLGVDLPTVYNLLTELAQFKADYTVEKQQSELKQMWGEDYEVNLQEVKDYWSKLPKEQQSALDNIEGAKLIAALVQQGRATQQSGLQAARRTNYVNQGRQSASFAGTKTAKFRRSDILAMSQKEYESRANEIERAYRENKVLID